MNNKKHFPDIKSSVEKPLASPNKEVLPPVDAKILIAGNERRFNKSLKALLLLNGHAPTIALTEQDAVALLAQEQFALIILDLKMVEIYGPSMMEHLKSKQGSSKLIMLSHDSVIDQAVWALRQGADDFFRTPYSPDELLLSIQNQLSHNTLKNESLRSQTQLQSSELLHRYMVDNSPDIIYLLDQDGKFSFFNNQVEKLLGFSKEELLGKHFSTLIHPADLEKSRYVFSERRTGKRASKDIELRLLHKNNGSNHLLSEPVDVDVELYATGVYKDNKKGKEKVFLGTYGVVRDISQRKATEKQFHHQLYHDLLTNLPNRSLFQDRLRLALSQSKRNSNSLAVMFLDIDGFKEINDSFGHACGDNLLQAFSVRLKSCLRESDTLARISGDEFTILIPLINSSQDTAKIAKKIIDEFKVPFRMIHTEITIGVSIGIAISPEDSESDEELIQKADWAMYYVKHHGKNGFMHYEESLSKPGSQYSPGDDQRFEFKN